MFTLIAEIDAADLKVILEAEERLVLVKNIGSGRTVAWAAPVPLLRTQFEWGSGYSLFASASPSRVGTPLAVSADTKAEGGCAYPFTAAGFGAGQPHGGLGPDQYRVDNRVPVTQSAALLFGLAQTIVVNGNASPAALPLNAETVPAMQSTIQDAADSVTIYLQSGIAASQIVVLPSAFAKSSMSGTLVVPFAAGVATRTVKYSAQLGRFMLAS